MPAWFKCRACGKMTNYWTGGCPSCGRATVDPHEGPDEAPIQSQLFLIPDPPRPIRWKIEWRWTPDVIKNALELFNETLPDAWFFHSEYSTERQAVNAVARLRRNFGRRAKHYRSKPCLWNHNGDIVLNVVDLDDDGPPEHISEAIDEFVSGMAKKAAESVNKLIDPAKFGPYCGTDYCDDPACLTHEAQFKSPSKPTDPEEWPSAISNFEIVTKT